MASTTTYSASTFKPQIDKWTAKDGAAVVLWANSDEILLLRFASGRWEVTRHPAIESFGDVFHASITWQGTRYAGAGARLAEFSVESPNSEWDEFYADCQRRQRQVYRDSSVSSAGDPALTA